MSHQNNDAIGSLNYRTRCVQGWDHKHSVWRNHVVDPAFRLMRFPLDGELDSYFENDFTYSKMTWSCHLFLFYFKRVNKIRKKTLSVTPYFGKGDLRKTRSGSGSGYLAGRYGKDRSTPLSP